MLIDVLLVCAPLMAALPAVAAVLISRANLTSTSRSQKRLYATLLLVEKLPAGVPGGGLIHHDVDRQTLNFAYLTQYPQRAREVLLLSIFGGCAAVLLGAYYLLWWRDTALLTLIIALAVLSVVSLGFERALVTFGHNDELARELFTRLGAPADLVRPRTPLFLGAPKTTADTVLERAATVRDAHHVTSMTTVGAVNAVLTRPHFEFDWRREALRTGRLVAAVDYRALAGNSARRATAYSARSYDWALRRVVDPVFTRRLAYLDIREHHRAHHAQRTGDLRRAAWLPVHYRNERRRIADQWAQLHKAKNLTSADVRTHVGNARSAMESTARRISESARATTVPPTPMHSAPESPVATPPGPSST